MSPAEILALLMFASACAALMAGYNVASTLGGISLAFAALATALGLFDPSFLLALPGRIFPLVTRDILIAVPLFVFMGVMLEKSRIAEELLESMGDLLGTLRGGLGMSIIVVGALLAASTGIVGATVVTMGLLSLPTLLRRGYDPGLASGAIAASGTLGQIIPPSIILVILGDQMSNAYQEAQRNLGLGGNDVLSVADLFTGAIVPGLILVVAYILYILCVAIVRPTHAPRADEVVRSPGEARAFLWRAAKSVIPPILLIVAVLGSILSGYATPTRGAALGALGATLLAGYKTGGPLVRRGSALAAIALTALVVLDFTGIDLRLGQSTVDGVEAIALPLAVFLFALASLACLFVTLALGRTGQLGETSRATLHITTMVFFILIGATVFSLVFRGLGGDEFVARLLVGAPGGLWGAFALVMVIMFVLGFFLDSIEITFVVVPLVAPPLLAAGLDPVWLGVVFALNLQTSFLTPPFGFALFYLRGVAPPEVTTPALYRGVLPFIAIQVVVIALVVTVPGLVIR